MLTITPPTHFLGAVIPNFRYINKIKKYNVGPKFENYGKNFFIEIKFSRQQYKIFTCTTIFCKCFIVSVAELSKHLFKAPVISKAWFRIPSVSSFLLFAHILQITKIMRLIKQKNWCIMQKYVRPNISNTNVFTYVKDMQIFPTLKIPQNAIKIEISFFWCKNQNV